MLFVRKLKGLNSAVHVNIFDGRKWSVLPSRRKIGIFGDQSTTISTDARSLETWRDQNMFASPYAPSQLGKCRKGRTPLAPAKRFTKPATARFRSSETYDVATSEVNWRFKFGDNVQLKLKANNYLPSAVRCHTGFDCWVIGLLDFDPRFSLLVRFRLSHASSSKEERFPACILYFQCKPLDRIVTEFSLSDRTNWRKIYVHMERVTLFLLWNPRAIPE